MATRTRSTVAITRAAAALESREKTIIPQTEPVGEALKVLVAESVSLVKAAALRKLDMSEVYRQDSSAGTPRDPM